ncbi:hypothetical protein FACS1894216_02880 [Synergistales bacterium]|nr:hypothetical protein FACS1894216_02880 [Synergistales bacterium]
MPRVTVAICTYNRAGFLAESIRSALNQTYRDMKVVVFDDCSTDNTEDIVRSFGDEVEYIRNEQNLKLFGNMNKVIDMCDTEYLNVFHDDDRMFPYMIEKLVEALDANLSAGIAASCELHFLSKRDGIWESAKIPDPPNGTPCVLFNKNEYVRYILRVGGRHNLVHPSIMLRKRSIDEVNMRYCEERGAALDMYFFLETNSKGIPLIALPFPLLEYRLHESSISSTAGYEKFIADFKKIDDLISGLELGEDMRPMRGHTAWVVVRTAAASMKEPLDLKALRALRNRLKKEYNWYLPEALFSNVVRERQKKLRTEKNH